MHTFNPRLIALTVFMLAGAICLQAKTGQVGQVFAAPGSDPHNKIRICHRTDSQTNPYTNPDVDQDAVDGDLGNDHGQGDHYAEHNGPVWYAGIADHSWGDIIPPIAGVHDGKNWTTEGQAIWNNACNIATVIDPSPSPSVDPSPTPDPSEDPSPTPGIGGPIPSPSPSLGKRSSIGYDANCNENFDVVLDVTEDGNPVENVKVTFTYKGHDTDATTNKDGRARISLRKDGDAPITAKADGFPGADMYVTFRTDCPAGSVLGASTDDPGTKRTGKVLGASTLANTGAADVYSALMTLGAGALIMVGSLRYYIANSK